MKTIFDIGMYDGSDTEYYLSEGFRVIAIEANKDLVDKARDRFRDSIVSGKLEIINAAICMNPGETVTLSISGDDLGSSSTTRTQGDIRNPARSQEVKGTTISELINSYGVPYYIKIDIEGADRFCVLGMEPDSTPDYISFEAGDDAEELISHLAKIGYTRFKAINQCNFYNLHNQESLPYRLRRKIMHILGYSDPRYTRRHSRFFRLEHSAGPPPWISDGSWEGAESLIKNWRSAVNNNEIKGWYDIHASKLGA